MLLASFEINQRALGGDPDKKSETPERGAVLYFLLKIWIKDSRKSVERSSTRIHLNLRIDGA
jgi:hypothetical protein